MKKYLSLIIIFLLTLILFKDSITQRKLPLPTDSIDALYYPYKDFFAKDFPRGIPFKNFLITDPLRQQYPWKEVSIESLKKFELPLWNPYNGAGEPMSANFQSGAFYPLNFLFVFLPFTASWSLLIFLQPLLAGVFMFVYLRNLKISHTGSLLGAIAFAFCGFNTAWLEWGNIVHTGLWLPLILLSIDKIFNNSESEKFYKLNLSIGQNKLRIKKIFLWSLIFTAGLTFSFFAGHLQTFFYVFVFTLIYSSLRWYQYCKNFSHLIKFSLLFIIFILLSAVQWIPTLQLINLSSRAIDQLWSKDGWFVPFANLAQFVSPDYFGNPTTLNYFGVWNYAEFVGYVGIAPLFFGLYSLKIRRDKKTLFYASALLVSLLFAFATPIAKLPFILRIPFISTAQPTRLIFIVDFSLCVLCGLGADYFLKTYKRLFPAIGIFILLLIGLWLPILFKKLNFGISPQNLLIMQRNLYLPTGFAVLTFVLTASIVLFKGNKTFKKILIGMIVILIAFDLLRFSWKFNVFTDQKFLYPQTKTVKFLKDSSKDYPWRFLGIDYVKDEKRILPPNLSMHDKLYTLDTYNPLLLKRYQEFAAVSEWGFTDVPDFSFNRSIILNNYNSKLVDFLGVKYILSINDIRSDKLKFLFNEGDTRIYENTKAFDRAFMVYDTVYLNDKKQTAKKIYDKNFDLRRSAVVNQEINLHGSSAENSVKVDSYQENKIEITVKTANKGLLVLTDNYYPTWKALICPSGKNDCEETPIILTDYTFRGVVVPKGEYKIIFEDNIL